MQVVEYNPDLHPYGPLYMGGKPYLAYIPELRRVHPESLPVEVIEIVAATMNADLRAGWGIPYIEEITPVRVRTAEELL